MTQAQAPARPPSTHPTATQLETLRKIDHIIIIFQENRSFDSLYGRFPGANGIPPLEATPPQVDMDGRPYTTLPRPLIFGHPDHRFPPDLPNAPFDMDQYVDIDEAVHSLTGVPVHRFYQNIDQISGGRMDRFVAWATRDWPGETATGGLPMAYVDATNLPTGRLAQQYVLCDSFFQSAFGGSSLNHFFLIAATPMHFPDPPKDMPGMMIKLDDQGRLVEDGAVSPDGWVVNNIQDSVRHWTEEKGWPPLQSFPTIGDRLRDKGISWKWYAESQDLIGLDPAVPRIVRNSWYVVQPFRYFRTFATGTPAARAHLVDLLHFDRDLEHNQLPAVSFVKHFFPHDEHPGDSPLLLGQAKVAGIVKRIQASPIWDRSLIIITYDENGGLWDHAAPPKRDRFGPGPRVPAVIISPFAKRGYVDHTQYETISILKLIETRFDLEPLNQRDTNAPNLLGWMDVR